MSTSFTRAGENGRLKLAVPAKGRLAEPSLRLCADAGLSLEVTERSLVVPCANAPVDLLLVRPSDIPEYAQDGVADPGSRAPTSSSRPTSTSSLSPSSGSATAARRGRPRRRAAARDHRPRRAARRDRVPVIDVTSPRGARRLVRARAGVRLGRGHAATRARRRDRRPRLDRLDDGRERARPVGTLLDPQAVLVGGRAAVEARGDLVERLELMLSGVVAAVAGAT